MIESSDNKGWLVVEGSGFDTDGFTLVGPFWQLVHANERADISELHVQVVEMIVVAKYTEAPYDGDKFIIVSGNGLTEDFKFYGLFDSEDEVNEHIDKVDGNYIISTEYIEW